MNIALLGFGVVGRGVYDQVCRRSDMAVTRVLVRRTIDEIAPIATADINDILADEAVDTAQIKDGAVTADKLAQSEG